MRSVQAERQGSESIVAHQLTDVDPEIAAVLRRFELAELRPWQSLLRLDGGAMTVAHRQAISVGLA